MDSLPDYEYQPRTARRPGENRRAPETDPGARGLPLGVMAREGAPREA
jgi:hypothetical protein